jgi:hypothetical protein
MPPATKAFLPMCGVKSPLLPRSSGRLELLDARPRFRRSPAHPHSEVLPASTSLPRRRQIVAPDEAHEEGRGLVELVVQKTRQAGQGRALGSSPRWARARARAADATCLASETHIVALPPSSAQGLQRLPSCRTRVQRSQDSPIQSSSISQNGMSSSTKSSVGKSSPPRGAPPPPPLPPPRGAPPPPPSPPPRGPPPP